MRYPVRRSKRSPLEFAEEEASWNVTEQVPAKRAAVSWIARLKFPNADENFRAAEVLATHGFRGGPWHFDRSTKKPRCMVDMDSCAR